MELRLQYANRHAQDVEPDESDQLGSSIASAAPLDPQAAAEKALAAIDPTTAVVVDRTARVAGRAAYQLQLSPKDSRSLIGSVQIAIDAATSVPLRLQIFAVGASSPAFQVGFTSVSFNVPSSSIFEFVPPAGANVEQDTAPFGDTLNSGPFGDGAFVVQTKVTGGAGPPPGTLVTPANPVTVTPDRKTTELGKGWTEVIKITNAVPACLPTDRSRRSGRHRRVGQPLHMGRSLRADRRLPSGVARHSMTLRHRFPGAS